VAIIDHGRIVADGTPAALKDEIADPSVEVLPADPAEQDRAQAVLDRFGSSGDSPRSTDQAAAVRLAGGDSKLADVVRALDSEGIEVADLQLHAPTLDDVFLAKTGRTLEGAAEEEPEAEPAEAAA
jgi:ABC-2 type transport system ATP-binding protein